MILKEYNKKLQIVIRQRNIVILIATCFLVLLISITILLSQKSKTIILIPSYLQNEMRISSNGVVSKNYTEQFARDIIYTMLNITAHSIKYSNKTILSITNPKLHKDLSHKLAIYEKDVIKKDISTYFTLHNIKFKDKSNLNILATGELVTFIGKNLVSKEKKQYQLNFKLNSTKLSLIGFKEIIKQVNEK